MLCSVLTLAVAFFLVSQRACIGRLVAILEECTKIFSGMFLILVWPLLSVALSLGLLAFGVVMTYFLPQAWPAYEQQAAAVVCLWLVVLWTCQVIKAAVWTSMSCAVCEWFVTTNAPTGVRSRAGVCCCAALGRCVCTPCSKWRSGAGPLLCGSWLVLRKHLGSMAFGAAVLTLVQLLRLFMAAVDCAYSRARQVAQPGRGGTRAGAALSCALSCVHCALACLQRVVATVSYFGFVVVAMRGENFCKACVGGAAFIGEHAAQTAVNKTVQWMLKLLVGLSTPLLCTFGAAVYLQQVDGGAYASAYNPAWAAAVVLALSCAWAPIIAPPRTPSSSPPLTNWHPMLRLTGPRLTAAGTS